jgi:hypothetical protein
VSVAEVLWARPAKSLGEDAVRASSLAALRLLVLLGLLFQLSTLLLVLAGPVPSRPGVSTNTAFHSAGAGGSSATPLSDR